ncbi:hypothetical protein XAP6164_320011 [Xanthomonas phaseoli pv. phaseoli]|nr:hypothetical protein XAP6164_320011 [Xanthomonas phaseoli pv. phaseoli]
MTRGFARTLIRPFGPPSPDGRRVQLAYIDLFLKARGDAFVIAGIRWMCGAPHPPCGHLVPP